MFLKNLIQNIDDTVSIDATIQNVVNLMSKNKLHHILIVDNKKAIGILTEKDIVNLYKNNINFHSLAVDYAKKELITLHSTRLAQYALTIMIDNNIRKIIVVNSDDEYLGCIEQEDIVYHFEKEIHSTDTSIEQLLNSSNTAIIIDENESLQYTLDTMDEHGITSLLISHKDKVVGIISESDVVRLAQQRTNRNIAVKIFMHSPIITIEASKNVSDMIDIMKSHNIRRVVVQTKSSNRYHILNSKDLTNNLKGNYAKFLELKLFDTRNTFNALSESIIELIDIDNEQVIYWTNSITKENFNINIDDPITKIIPKELWDSLLKKLLNDKVIFETIHIQKKYFQLKGSYGTLLNNKIIKLFLYDITKITNINNQLQKQNELQQKLLFEQQKMVQMGEMIGNIAHQWRQPLSTISVAASGMKVQKDFHTLSDDDFDTMTSTIITNVDYLSRTIDTFKNFLKEKKELKELILEQRIENTLIIIDTSLKNNYIELINNIDYEKQTPMTMFLGELDQVIINIINNAKDALVENNIPSPWIEINLLIENHKAIITIEDNAGGIPHNILDKIFEEYFTTKHASNGTGLGLYMSHKIIKESFDGKLYAINSTHGAKFFIELPLKK